MVWPGGWTAQGTPQVRPCRLGNRSHAADTPAQPTRRASDSFRVRPSTEEKKRRAGAKAGRFAPWPSGADPFSAGKLLRPLLSSPDTRNRLCFRLCRPLRPMNLARPGWCGLAGVSAAWMPRPSPQGWVYGVPCQPIPPRPTHSTTTRQRSGRCRCRCCCTCCWPLPAAGIGTRYNDRLPHAGIPSPEPKSCPCPSSA